MQSGLIGSHPLGKTEAIHRTGHFDIAEYDINGYTQELMSFPGSKDDDQVDSTTQALEWFQNRKLGFFS